VTADRSDFLPKCYMLGIKRGTTKHLFLCVHHPRPVIFDHVEVVVERCSGKILFLAAHSQHDCRFDLRGLDRSDSADSAHFPTALLFDTGKASDAFRAVPNEVHDMSPVLSDPNQNG